MFLLFNWLLRLLTSERGETPDTVTGNVDADTGDDASADAAVDTSASTDAATQDGEGDDAAASGGDESQPGYKEGFMAPKDMPPEIKGHFGKMLSTYQKKLAEIEDIKENAAIVRNFWEDPAYAKQVLTARAQQLGMTLSEAGEGSANPKPPATVNANLTPAPDKLVRQFESRYGEGNEAQARADADMLYNNTLDTMRQVFAPYQEQAAKTKKEQAEAEYKSQAEDLSQKHPGWEENEDEMDGLLEFLQSGSQTHPVYGNKLMLLYQLNDLRNGNGNATAEAVRRIGAAGNNRTRTGSTGGSATLNTDDRVRKAVNNQEAMKIAAEAAMDELRRNGQTIPD
tara:strand:- start:56 stop:1078 length:1023 start_codon:yes stop_codon:yes gene_type:complete